MKVYFEEITFKKKTIVWEYHEHTNSAECLFITKNQAELTKKDVIEVLREYPEISLTENSAEIKDYMAFIEQYKPSNILPVRVKEHSRRSMELGHRSIVRKTSGSLSLSTIFHKPVPNSPRSEKKKYPSITLRELIVARNDDHQDVYRNTLYYKDKFINTMKEFENSKGSYLMGTADIKRKEQCALNTQSFIIRTEIINQIEELFDKELNPAYVDWLHEAKPGNDDLEVLHAYLRSAVENTMLNSAIKNDEPTSFELMKYDDIKHFATEEQFEKMKLAARMLMVEFMISKLSNLIVDTHKHSPTKSVAAMPRKKSEPKPVKDIVSTFATYLTHSSATRVKHIQKHLEIIKEKIFQSGMHDCFMKQSYLMSAMQLDKGTKKIEGFSSVIATVIAKLEETKKPLEVSSRSKHSKPVKVEECSSLNFSNIANEILFKFMNSLIHNSEIQKVSEKYISCLSTNYDKDIFMKNEWMESCNNVVDWNFFISSKAVKISDKKIQKYLDEIVKKWTEIILEKVKAIMAEVQSKREDTELTLTPSVDRPMGLF